MGPLVSLLILCALLGACSTLVEEKGLSLECRGEECPSIEHVGSVMLAFSDRVPGFDMDTRMHVVWRDDAEVVASTGLLGFAYPWYDEVHVSSSCVLAHELMHCWLDFSTGDPGAEHLDGGWPWTLGAELAVKDVCDQFRGELEF